VARRRPADHILRSYERYPFIQKHADAMVGGGIEERFEFGLDMLMDGLDKYTSQS
jgi:hypothetical protein